MKKLTLLGRDFEFFWGERKTNTKPIEIWPFFLVVTFFLYFSLSDAYYSWKGTMRIPVTTHAAQFLASKEFALRDSNAFVLGGSTSSLSNTTGALVWHPQSLPQALILKMTDTDNLNFMDISHVALLYLYVLVFYVMTRNNKNDLVFSKRVRKGFKVLFFMIAMTGTIELEKHKLLNKYVEHITNGQFSLPEVTIQWYYFYLGIMLVVLSRFTDRAAELQKEAELTI